MDGNELRNEMQEFRYPSQKIQRVRFFFNRHGYDFMTWRYGSDVLSFLLSRDKPRILLNFKEFNVRDDEVEVVMMEFYREAKDMIDVYEKTKGRMKSQVISDVHIDLHTKLGIEIQPGDIVKIFEPTND